MNGRNALIGQIIDDLERIANQLEVRGQMGLFDIHRHIEDVFGQILSIAFDCDLINLNEENANTPGLDLGDKAEKTGFQITASKSSSKIDGTLEKITDEQLKDYEKIYVYVAVKKQRSYTLDATKCQRCHNFTEDLSLIHI